tara:strand:+ start:1451 stop:2101 length:651 start_codon:yes stop_codon:yes gene_type:complete
MNLKNLFFVLLVFTFTGCDFMTNDISIDQHPRTWQRVGSLHLNGKNDIKNANVVKFYVTREMFMNNSERPPSGIWKEWKMEENDNRGNVVVQIIKFKSKFSQLSSKEYASNMKKGLNELGKSYVSNRLEKIFKNLELHSVSANIKVHNNYFSKVIFSWDSGPSNNRVISHKYGTIYNGIRYDFVISYFGDYSFAADTSMTEDIIGTIKFSKMHWDN